MIIPTDFKPYFWGLLYGLLLLGFWYLSVILVELTILSDRAPSTAKDLFIPGIGTFVGAFAAFKFNIHKDKENEKNNKIMAVNKALNVLSRQYSHLKNYYDQFIVPVNKSSLAWFELMPTLEYRRNNINFNQEELSFLLSSHGQLVQKLSREEDTYIMINGLINTRWNVFEKNVYPKMEKAGLGATGTITSSALESILGSRTVGILESTYKGIIETLPLNIKGLKSIHNELRRSILDLYPDSKPIRIDFDQAIDDDSAK
ncbi:MAG: hypothetical protein KAS48_05950 [Gammaproteobacteria bacterium]|nr:hypothetical protein [Gammaproteobacteria bacterium]